MIIKAYFVILWHKNGIVLKRTDNQSKFDTFRKEFSTFTFERQTVKLENGILSLAFDFMLDDRYHFRPTLEVPARAFFHWDTVPAEQLETLAFQIGMTELVSYWKIACPKRVMVKRWASGTPCRPKSLLISAHS